jgi:hypothetical protein
MSRPSGSDCLISSPHGDVGAFGWLDPCQRVRRLSCASLGRDGRPDRTGVGTTFGEISPTLTTWASVTGTVASVSIYKRWNKLSVQAGGTDGAQQNMRRLYEGDVKNAKSRPKSRQFASVPVTSAGASRGQRGGNIPPCRNRENALLPGTARANLTCCSCRRAPSAGRAAAYLGDLVCDRA